MSGIAKMSTGKRVLVNAEENSVRLVFPGIIFPWDVPTEQLCFSARGKLMFFEEGMDVNEEFSHGCDDGAFVGFASVTQSFDIGGNNGVAVGCGVRGHVEASANLGATADDRALAGELAAVAVEGGDTRKSDQAVAVEMFDFTEIGQEGPCGDFAYALDGLNDFGTRFEFGLRADKFIDGFVDGADFLFEDFDHALDRTEDELLAVLNAVFLTGELLDEVSPAVEEGSQLGAVFGGSFHRAQGFAFGKGENHLGVDGVCLRAHAFAAGEVTDSGRVNHRQRNLLFVKEFAKAALVAARGLEDDQRVLAGLEMSQELEVAFGIVVDSERLLVVLDLKGGFGNIDGDVVNRVGVGGFCHGFSRSCRGELAKINSRGSVNCLRSSQDAAGDRCSVMNSARAGSGHSMISPAASPEFRPELWGDLALPTLHRQEDISGKNCGLRPLIRWS